MEGMEKRNGDFFQQIMQNVVEQLRQCIECHGGRLK